eukprot:3041684-Prorocentrum_lima.AAC.1
MSQQHHWPDSSELSDFLELSRTKLPRSQLPTSDLSCQPNVSSVTQPPGNPCGTEPRIFSLW